MVDGVVERARRGTLDRILELAAQLLEAGHRAIQAEAPGNQEAAQADEGVGPGWMVVRYLLNDVLKQVDRGCALLAGRLAATQGEAERAAEHALQERDHGMLVAELAGRLEERSRRAAGDMPARSHPFLEGVCHAEQALQLASRRIILGHQPERLFEGGYGRVDVSVRVPALLQS